jgi:hypothetical protein
LIPEHIYILSNHNASIILWTLTDINKKLHISESENHIH